LKPLAQCTSRRCSSTRAGSRPAPRTSPRRNGCRSGRRRRSRYPDRWPALDTAGSKHSVRIRSTRRSCKRRRTRARLTGTRSVHAHRQRRSRRRCRSRRSGRDHCPCLRSDRCTSVDRQGRRRRSTHSYGCTTAALRRRKYAWREACTRPPPRTQTTSTRRPCDRRRCASGYRSCRRLARSGRDTSARCTRPTDSPRRTPAHHHCRTHARCRAHTRLRPRMTTTGTTRRCCTVACAYRTDRTREKWIPCTSAGAQGSGPCRRRSSRVAARQPLARALPQECARSAAPTRKRSRRARAQRPRAVAKLGPWENARP